jgi:hypothetical protein
VSGCVTTAPSASSLGPAPAARRKPFNTGVALSKKILDYGLGRIDQLSPIADAACVPRCKDQREEGS